MMAQIVTVPLGLTRPVMLRSPSAAADHGWPVAAFSRVGKPNREAGPVAEAIPLHEQTPADCRSCRIGRAAVSASSMAWLRPAASCAMYSPSGSSAAARWMAGRLPRAEGPSVTGATELSAGSSDAAVGNHRDRFQPGSTLTSAAQVTVGSLTPNRKDCHADGHCQPGGGQSSNLGCPGGRLAEPGSDGGWRLHRLGVWWNAAPGRGALTCTTPDCTRGVPPAAAATECTDPRCVSGTPPAPPPPSTARRRTLR